MATNTPTLRHERALYREGRRLVAGIDEAGRGAWAGPVVAAAVILPARPKIGQRLRGVNDSKQLTALQRAMYRELIEQCALATAIGSATHVEIDRYGIVPATQLAMIRAVLGLAILPDALVIDALTLPALCIRQDSFNYADSLSLSVAAASILAKTERDAFMSGLDKTVPGYGFSAHKGYGTSAHQEALARLGVSRIHRRTFEPIRRLCLLSETTV